MGSTTDISDRFVAALAHVTAPTLGAPMRVMDEER